MSSSLSEFAYTLSEGLHNNICTDYKFYLDYMSAKGNQLFARCFNAKKYKKGFNENLIKRFASIHKVCDRDNKCILLIRKGVYP